MGIPATDKPLCTCLHIKAFATSQDYNARYLSRQKCPIHSVVPDDETKKYENVGKGKWDINDPRKNIMMGPMYAVMQAVWKGKDDQTGVKAFDTLEGWRAVSVFPTREDARLYLLDVLHTVQREQLMGIRSERNLDPSFEGGLDFRISPAYLIVAASPLRARGWTLKKLSTPRPVARRRKLTHTKQDRSKRGASVRIRHSADNRSATPRSARKVGGTKKQK